MANFTGFIGGCSAVIGSLFHAPPAPVYTAGHSNRSFAEFAGLLRAHGIKRVVDVRSFPKSRNNPQFHGSRFRSSVRRAGFDYIHIEELGGRRPALKNSTNLGWENKSFRGYADHMATPGFRRGLDQLESLSQEKPTVIVCAEAVPWRCHRSMIGDALTGDGFPVLDIMTETKASPHRIRPFMRAQDGVVSYPAPVKSHAN